jgi:NADH-quinone oxidoreductase subunit I
MAASHSHDAHGHDSHGETKGPIVLSVSDRSPKVRTIQVHRPTEGESSYLTATGKGMAITVRHFFRNLLGLRRNSDVLGAGGAPADPSWKENWIETVQYPDEQVQYPERFRGLHRLTLREDGAVRCVACMCCPTVCPAHCITIVPEESDSKGIEKRPARFEIDELRCVVCGLCVEACPCDAIRMDTGMHAKPVYERGDAIEDRESLLSRGNRSIAVQGGEGANWRETLK